MTWAQVIGDVLVWPTAVGGVLLMLLGGDGHRNLLGLAGLATALLYWGMRAAA